MPPGDDRDSSAGQVERKSDSFAEACCAAAADPDHVDRPPGRIPSLRLRARPSLASWEYSGGKGHSSAPRTRSTSWLGTLSAPNRIHSPHNWCAVRRSFRKRTVETDRPTPESLGRRSAAGERYLRPACGSSHALRAPPILFGHGEVMLSLGVAQSLHPDHRGVPRMVILSGPRHLFFRSASHAVTCPGARDSRFARGRIIATGPTVLPAHPQGGRSVSRTYTAAPAGHGMGRERLPEIDRPVRGRSEFLAIAGRGADRGGGRASASITRNLSRIFGPPAQSGTDLLRVSTGGSARLPARNMRDPPTLEACLPRACFFSPRSRHQPGRKSRSLIGEKLERKQSLPRPPRMSRGSRPHATCSAGLQGAQDGLELGAPDLRESKSWRHSQRVPPAGRQISITPLISKMASEDHSVVPRTRSVTHRPPSVVAEPRDQLLDCGNRMRARYWTPRVSSGAGAISAEAQSETALLTTNTRATGDRRRSSAC